MAGPIKITVRQLIELRRALNQLDAVKSGKDTELVPLEFDGKTRYRLMKIAVAVEPLAIAYDRSERAFAAEAQVYDGMDRNDANGKKIDAFKRKVEEAQDQEVEMAGVLKVRLNDLLFRPLPIDAKPTDKPRPNPIPQSLVNKLAPIIEEEES